MPNDLPTTWSGFWELYLKEHQNNLNRWLHTFGTVFSVALMIYCFTSQRYLGLILVPILGYGFAWGGHFFVEKNRPLSLRAPLRSLVCDYYLTVQMVLGRNRKLRRPMK